MREKVVWERLEVMGVMEGDRDENDEDNRTPEVGSLGNLGSGHIVRSFFPKYGPLTTFYQR